MTKYDLLIKGGYLVDSASRREGIKAFQAKDVQTQAANLADSLFYNAPVT